MSVIIAIYITLCGLVFGSFFNVVGLRVPLRKSVVRPPSQCSNCRTRLVAKDLVPVFSYLWTRGKCRYCQTSLSWVYPLGEALTGLLFLWVYVQKGLTGEGVIGLVLVSLSVIITVSDLKYMLIPNKILLFFLPLLIGLVLWMPIQSRWNHLLGAVVGGTIILLIALLTRGMGMGDVKLFFIYGWVLGFPHVLLAFIIACALGSIVGGVLIALRIIERKQPVPFGPWLAAGTLITYGYGTQIISGYFSLIG